MTFRKQLGIYLAKKFGSADNKRLWAEACGLDYNYFVVILSGAKSPPGEEKIIEIAKNLSLSENETETLLALALKEKARSPESQRLISKLLGNKPEIKLPALVEEFSKKYKPIELKEDHKIPVYSTIKAGAGEMGVEGEIVDEISIDDDYRRQKVFAVRVSGNSMEPEIFDGEIAIFKPINGEPRKDRDIFAVEVEGWASWVIKFVREDASGMVQLISANQTYQVKEIDPKITRITLRGRLIESRRIRK